MGEGTLGGDCKILESEFKKIQLWWGQISYLLQLLLDMTDKHIYIFFLNDILILVYSPGTNNWNSIFKYQNYRVICFLIKKINLAVPQRLLILLYCLPTKGLARTILLTVFFHGHLQRQPQLCKGKHRSQRLGHSPGQLPQSHFRTPGKPPRWRVLWSYVSQLTRAPFQTQNGLSQGHLSDQFHRLSTGHTLARC